MSRDPTPFATPASPLAPMPGKRRKTGGRRKGTPNRTTRAVRDALLEVFARLQDEAGGENEHLIHWARANPTDFYRLSMRLLPSASPISEPAEPITEVRWTIVRPPAFPKSEA